MTGAHDTRHGDVRSLWRRVRDLPARSLTLLRSLASRRFALNGLVSVPGDGPVVLLIETMNPAALRAIKAAVDRHVTVFEPQAVEGLRKHFRGYNEKEFRELLFNYAIRDEHAHARQTRA